MPFFNMFLESNSVIFAYYNINRISYLFFQINIHSSPNYLYTLPFNFPLTFWAARIMLLPPPTPPSSMPINIPNAPCFVPQNLTLFSQMQFHVLLSVNTKPKPFIVTKRQLIFCLFCLKLVFFSCSCFNSQVYRSISMLFLTLYI